jgi:hypothetical protein
MLPIRHRGTVPSMSIRAAISGLLAGDSEMSNPAAALEEAGYDNIPAEAFGTALTHFSDTATLDEADALAPVVTRTGPIRFEESDLPEIDVEVDDAFSLFGSTVTTVHQDFGESDLDEVDELDEKSAPVGSDDEDGPDTAQEADFDFGQPSVEPAAQPEAQASPDDPFVVRSPESSEQSSGLVDAESVEPFDADRETESIETAEPSSADESDDPFDDELEVDL